MRKILLAAMAALVPTLAQARETRELPGPYMAEVVDVYDGDTFNARVEIWPGLFTDVAIRVKGIDTPEKRGKCAREVDLAEKARSLTERTLAESKVVLLYRVSLDKYAGRVDAVVVTKSGMDISKALLSQNLARPYDGGTKSEWCK